MPEADRGRANADEHFSVVLIVLRMEREVPWVRFQQLEQILARDEGSFFPFPVLQFNILLPQAETLKCTRDKLYQKGSTWFTGTGHESVAPFPPSIRERERELRSPYLRNGTNSDGKLDGRWCVRMAKTTENRTDRQTDRQIVGTWCENRSVDVQFALQYSVGWWLSLVGLVVRWPAYLHDTPHFILCVTEQSGFGTEVEG